MKRNTMKRLSAILCVVMLFSLMSTGALAYSNPQTDTRVTAEEIEAAQASLQIAKEGIVLLENNNGALPIASEGDVALFGIGSVQTTKGGIGSGSVNNRIVYADGTVVEGSAIAVSVLDGFLNAGYNVLTEDYLREINAANPDKTSGMGMGGAAMTDDPLLTEAIDSAKLTAFSMETDTAIYTIRRNAGEGADRGVEGDYNLSENELKNIQLLAETFDKLVVLLNVVNCDASWFADSGADALVLVSNPGELGGDAIVSVLCGETNPSGKLADTWATSIYDWPSTEYFSNLNADDPWADKIEYYYEDVFVGYRYFDTFAADKILYDFGYGLSYTSFDIAVEDVTADAESIAVTATVTNTGDVAGKEVVQVYFSAPEGTLLKPYQELIAYAKTDELAAGASQTLTLSFQTSEMSSYSEEQAAYILEAGDYVIRVGNSSGNTVPAAVITLDETAVTEQLANMMSIDRDGEYPGGASGEFAETRTTEENVAQYEEFSAAFLEANKGGMSLDGGSDAPIRLSIAAKDIVTANPYEEKGVDPYSNDVTAHVSATTEEEFIGTVGYDYAQNREYNIARENYTDASGALIDYRVKEGSEEDGTVVYYTLIDVVMGELTLDQFISGLTVAEMADIVEGGSKSPDASGQSSGGASRNTAKAGQEVVNYINAEAVDGQAGQTVGLYIESRAIPTITNADGPAGLRISQSYTGLDGETYYQYCTAYPVGTMIAQTWNTDLAYLMGQYVGSEMLRYGVTEWLAPGMDIHRNPLCGRNFEYYSEDPFLSGMTGGYEVLGVQSNPGVGVTIKHYAGNEQENSRNSENDVVTERAFREIYLKQFETAVKISNPMGIMTSYNVVNGVPTANDYELNENILRTEWGFDGLVMTDWGGSGGMTDAMAMHAGNDLIMPGNSADSNIIAYVADSAPDFSADAEGKAANGYPSITVSSGMMGGGTSADWGDYKLSASGEPITVVTTEEAFTGDVITTGSSREMKEQTVQEAVDALVAEGTASYEIKDGSVTVTYYATQSSLSDGTHYADAYAEHPVTVVDGDTNLLSLADLQKSVKHILTVCMRSLQWQEVLDEYEAETGEDMSQYAVGSFTEAVGDTVAYVEVTRSGEAETELWDAYVDYLYDYLVNTELPVNTNGMTQKIIDNEFMPLIEAGNFEEAPAVLLFNGLLDSGVAMTFEEFSAQ